MKFVRLNDIGNTRVDLDEVDAIGRERVNNDNRLSLILNSGKVILVEYKIKEALNNDLRELDKLLDTIDID